MIDYNIAAVTESETDCFSLKTATKIENPIETFQKFETAFSTLIVCVLKHKI